MIKQEALVNNYQGWWKIYKEEKGLVYIGLKHERAIVHLNDIIRRRNTIILEELK